MIYASINCHHVRKSSIENRILSQNPVLLPLLVGLALSFQTRLSWLKSGGSSSSSFMDLGDLCCSNNRETDLCCSNNRETAR